MKVLKIKKKKKQSKINCKSCRSRTLNISIPIDIFNYYNCSSNPNIQHIFNFTLTNKMDVLKVLKTTVLEIDQIKSKMLLLCYPFLFALKNLTFQT